MPVCAWMKKKEDFQFFVAGFVVYMTQHIAIPLYATNYQLPSTTVSSYYLLPSLHNIIQPTITCLQRPFPRTTFYLLYIALFNKLSLAFNDPFLVVPSTFYHLYIALFNKLSLAVNDPPVLVPRKLSPVLLSFLFLSIVSK